MDTRVITIVDGSADGASASSLVAQNIAAGLAYSGRKVLLADATSGQASADWARVRTQARIRPRIKAQAVRCDQLRDCLERECERYDLVVIDAGGAGDRSTLCALIAAQVAVILVETDFGAAVRVPPPAGLLYQARLFNPGLDIVRVALCPEADPDGAALQKFGRDALRLGAARTTSTALHLATLRSGAQIAGHCLRDQQGSAGAAQIGDLLREICPTRDKRQFFNQKVYS
ncbi:hypothetical protein GCM10027321_02150 [Massilia terrae]|uniref:Uncharacterized protein n=1 Tax=Massilia terrae TaxID=1811224 RepID=A0ABT2CTW9_9BURK|nr:hypothetical protein [Massilia terrae]MCS0657421.1 hypothetical protein [Massilia terrae]